MITSNVIQRVFQIETSNGRGTCFTVDVDNRQYIVTARHLFDNSSAQETIKILHNSEWKTIKSETVGVTTGQIDVAVLKTNIQLSPRHPLEISSTGLSYGQDVFFLGFPYGLSEYLGKLNNDFPFPFVKKATVSCFSKTNDMDIIYLDGHNNPGFSGGPVVFKKYNANTSNNYYVCGIISGYRFEQQLVHGDKNLSQCYIKENTGIIICYDASYAKNIIQSNPIGFKLPALY